jgi:hypothetical protein
MFMEPIVKRIEARIRSSVGHASGTAIALIALLVAIGFVTAAADSYLVERYGVQIADLILSAAYLLLALIVYASAQARKRRQDAVTEAESAETPGLNPMKATLDQLNRPNLEQKLLAIAGKNGPPVAKAVADQAVKNAHVLIGVAIGIYIASRLADVLRRRGYGS